MSSNLSLDQLLKQKQPIYVMNSASRDEFAASASIILHVQEGKNTRTESIPFAQIPIRLDGKYSRKSLRSCQDLRNCIDKGFLSLVDPAAAERMLANPVVQEMLRRIRMLETSEGKASILGEQLGIDVKTSANIKGGTPQIHAIIEALKDGRLSEDNACIELNMNERLCTQEDLGMIMKAAGRDYPKVNRWALNRLQEDDMAASAVHGGGGSFDVNSYLGEAFQAAQAPSDSMRTKNRASKKAGTKKAGTKAASTKTKKSLRKKSTSKQ